MREAVCAALLLAIGCSREPRALLPLPDFSFTAVGPVSESAFNRKNLLGRVWIAEFIFTRCSGPCPILTERLSKLSAALPPEVGVLCVTVDPDNDTPERLRAYASSRGLAPERWIFLRATLTQTYDLLFSGFRLPMSTQPEAAPEARVIHTTRLVLIDKDAVIRGYYDGLSDFGNSRLTRDALRLLEVKS